MSSSPTRLTTGGASGRSTRSLSQSPPTAPSGGGGSGPSGSPGGGSLSADASRLLDGADALLAELEGLTDALETLQQETSGPAKRSVSSLSEQAGGLIGSVHDLKQSIREEGATAANEGSLEDFSDVASEIARSARNVRATAPSASPGDPEDGLSEHTSEHQQEAESGAGGTATAVMFLGGAALTAWIISQSGQNGGEDKSSGGGSPVSPAILGYS